jgi:hypothetical protein
MPMYADAVWHLCPTCYARFASHQELQHHESLRHHGVTVRRRWRAHPRALGPSGR